MVCRMGQLSSHLIKFDRTVNLNENCWAFSFNHLYSQPANKAAARGKSFLFFPQSMVYYFGALLAHLVNERVHSPPVTWSPRCSNRKIRCRRSESSSRCTWAVIVDSKLCGVILAFQDNRFNGIPGYIKFKLSGAITTLNADNYI